MVSGVAVCARAGTELMSAIPTTTSEMVSVIEIQRRINEPPHRMKNDYRRIV